MRFLKIDDNGFSALALSRAEALQIVHDLINQLADAPGAGSKEYSIAESNCLSYRRIAFMLDTAKENKIK